MPLFFFSVAENGEDIDPDDVGLEFATLEDACDEADRALRGMFAEAGPAVGQMSMTVLDENRRVVHRAHAKLESEDCEPGGDDRGRR